MQEYYSKLCNNFVRYSSILIIQILIIMAISRTNIALKGFKGKLGDWVVRRWGESTVLSWKPNTRHRKWSKLQKLNRKRFGEAMAYARRVLSNPEMMAYYRKKKRKMQTVWNVAVADFMLNPTIDRMDVSNYGGKKGDTIVVVANDKYAVSSVVVSILDAQGLEIESGAAVCDWTPGWTYTTVKNNRKWRGCKVVVEVTDRPGNVVSDFSMVEQT